MRRSAASALFLLVAVASCSKDEGAAPPGGEVDAGTTAPAADAGDPIDAGEADLGIAPDAGDAPVACNPACNAGERCRAGQCEPLDLTQWTRRTIDRAGWTHVRVALSPGQSYIAAHAIDGSRTRSQLVVVDARTGEERLAVTTGEPALVFVSDTEVAVYRERARSSVEIFDVTTGMVSRELPVNPGVQGFGMDMAITADGRQLALSRFGVRPSPSAVDVWDLETGARRDLTPLGREDPHPWQVDFSPDGTTVQTLGGWAGRNLASWATTTGQRGPTLALPGWGRALVWSADGAQLALGWHDMGRDGVLVVDGLGGNELRSRVLDGEVVGGGLRFHPAAPEHLILVTLDFDTDVTTAQVRSGDQLRLTWSDEFAGRGGGADVSRDGSTIVVGTVGAIHIWEN